MISVTWFRDEGLSLFAIALFSVIVMGLGFVTWSLGPVRQVEGRTAGHTILEISATGDIRARNGPASLSGVTAQQLAAPYMIVVDPDLHGNQLAETLRTMTDQGVVPLYLSMGEP